MEDNPIRSLAYDELQAAVGGDAAAIRLILKFEPAGGLEDKVFPPTYAGGVYAFEDRRIGEKTARAVLLDSVQSQANRLELALLRAFRDGDVTFPLISVDFGGKVEGQNKLSTLEAPHRLADAIFRDSHVGAELFRESALGKRFAAANIRNATAMLELCPTALIFGVWDSTGAAGGLGNKFARALVSEIIAMNAVAGVRTSSRVDPLGIEKCPLYEAEDGTWTVDQEEAKKDAEGEPVPFKRKKSDKGKPSEINHGNVTPDLVRYADNATVANPLKTSEIAVNYSLSSEDGTIATRSNVKTADVLIRKGDVAAGGVSMTHALQTTVLSMPALRRLCFPDDKGKSTTERNNAARTLLAALALVAISYQRKHGYFLRSRCDLLPVDQPVFEIVTTTTDVTKFTLSAKEAVAIYKKTVEVAKKARLPWPEEEIILTPKPALVQLVNRSRELAALEDGEE